jgi:pyrroloquinoline quinone biosynthesis protein D
VTERSGGAERLMIGPGSRPRLPPHVKLRNDVHRGPILLAPERVFTLDEVAAATLRLCDGTRPVAVITKELSQQYNGAEATILADIVTMLQGLADKGVITA